MKSSTVEVLQNSPIYTISVGIPCVPMHAAGLQLVLIQCVTQKNPKMITALPSLPDVM